MSERTARVFSWVAAAAAADGAGDGRISLAALCRAAPARLGVGGASVTAMTRQDVHAPVAASDALAGELEELQFTVGEGPCVAAFGFGSPMLVPDLAASTRWPGFTAAARDRGVGAVFAFPLHAGSVQLGVLELYRIVAGPLEAEVLADALTFADLALQLLLDSSRGLVEHPDYQPIDGVASGRDAVHQATGMIAVQLEVDMAEALARLRAHTFTGTASLSEVAADVVAHRLRFQPDPDPEPGGTS